MGEVERCGYALTDKDGEMYPCDRPATGWRWYQDVGDHEDLLDEACDWHANEGGRRLHEAEVKVARVEALADEWQHLTLPGMTDWDAAEAFRAALNGETP